MGYAIDFDGTIAYTNELKVEWIQQNTGIEVPPWKVYKQTVVPIIGYENYRNMIAEVHTEENTRRIPEIPGALAALKLLAQKGPVHVVTARWAEDSRFAFTWLEGRGAFDYIKAFHAIVKLGKTKGEVCDEESLHTLVDDEEKYFPDTPTVRKILFRYNCPEQPVLTKGIEYTTTWDEILQLI